MNESSSPSIGTQIRSALEAVYREFAAPAPSTIDGCPCCASTRGVDVLLTTPLRQISAPALSRYVSGAFLTIGSERDFRYLLPRILDVSINEPESAHFPEIVLGKLRLANWQSWSVEDRRTIETLLEAWFELVLERDLADVEDNWVGTEAEGLLCGAARAGLPLARWLVRLQEPRAVPVLEDLKERFPSRLSAFWDDVPNGFGELSTILAQGQA